VLFQISRLHFRGSTFKQMEKGKRRKKRRKRKKREW